MGRSTSLTPVLFKGQLYLVFPSNDLVKEFEKCNFQVLTLVYNTSSPVNESVYQ